MPWMARLSSCTVQAPAQSVGICGQPAPAGLTFRGILSCLLIALLCSCGADISHCSALSLSGTIVAI